MLEDKMDAVLADKVARVVFTADLSELASADIDTFLDTLEVEPFTDQQIARILGRLGLNGPAATNPARCSAEAPQRLPSRRLPSSRNVGYRLSCEELENRLPPSGCGNALTGSALEFGMPVTAVSAGATVRLWDDRQVMEIQGSADAWEENQPSSWDHGADLPNGEAAAGVSWDVLYGDLDYAMAGELQLAG
jgi:hypothetical protein